VLRFDEHVAPTGPGRISADAALAIAIVAELVYIGGRFLIRSSLQGMIATELVTTAWRLVILAFYVWLFSGALKRAWRQPARRALHPLLTVALAASILIVLAGGYWQVHDTSTMLVFALTTPVVAFREELFYRFILQDGLERKLGSLPAIWLSSLLFVLYHIGSQPMNLGTYVSLASFAILFGAVYQRTRSLRLVVAMHLIVDLVFIVSVSVLAPTWVFIGDVAVLFMAILGWSLDHSRERMGI
jgi:membrane protease YdiL (CAAX protease family)